MITLKILIVTEINKFPEAMIYIIIIFYKLLNFIYNVLKIMTLLNKLMIPVVDLRDRAGERKLIKRIDFIRQQDTSVGAIS